MIDRIGNDGLVTDFINLGIGPVRTGIFNVADIAVSVGAVMIGYLAYRPAPQQIDSDASHR